MSTLEQRIKTSGFVSTKQIPLAELLPKIEAFARLAQAGQVAELKQGGMDCPGNLVDCIPRVTTGGKYTRVDFGSSGRFMVDRCGNIWGIKGYGKIHRGHHYGTVNTTGDWEWGRYYPVLINPNRKKGAA